MSGRRRWAVWLACAAWAVAMPSAWSEDVPSQSGQDRVDQFMARYELHPAFQKAGRGLSNLFMGWLELPLNLEKKYSPSDAGASLMTGLAYGVFKGAIRTGVGAYETVTFFLPYPEDYAPILPTIEYFRKSTKRRPLLLE